MIENQTLTSLRTEKTDFTTVITLNRPEKHLVNRIVKDNDLMKGAIGLSESITNNPPIAIKSIKELMYSHDLNLASDIIPREHLVVSRILKTKDREEAVRSFLEKRPPIYQGL